MALPLIPIILAVSALGSGLVQGISSVKNAKAEAKAIQESTQAQINERARQAKKLMSQQKSSFLKGGVYFDSGSPLDVINETYDTSMKDISAMLKDANMQSMNLERQGKTAFAGSILKAVANAGMSYFGAGTLGAKATSGTTTANKFRSWWENTTGNYRGGFSSPSGNADKIA